MIGRTVFVLLLAAAAVSAKSYTVNLFQPAMFGNTELKPGEYKVEVNGDKAVIRSGKVREEGAVKVDTGNTRYDTTTVRFDNSGGKMKIDEIRIGGTKTKLVFTGTGTASRAVN